MKAALLTSTAVLIITLSSATVRNVPANYSTIQSALVACATGDTVLVQPGSYNENLVWPAVVNSIKMIGLGGSTLTQITAGGSGRVLIINSSLIDTSTHITGFTFADGYIASGNGYGAGIYMTDASVIFDDILITNNLVYVPSGHGYGAGIHLDNSASMILNSSISGNFIDSATWCYGAGIYISGGNVLLENVHINGNHSNPEIWCYGVGLFARAYANVTLKRVRVAENSSGNNAGYYYGNGVYLGNVTASLTNVVVVNNVSGSGGNFDFGGGIFCDGNMGQVSMMNVTIAGNSKVNNDPIIGSGVYVRDADVTAANCIFYNQNPDVEVATNLNGTIAISYSNVRGGFGGLANLDVIPGFISSLDFHLLPSSLCAGAGTSVGAPAFDFDGNPRPLPIGTMPDMGSYEVDQTTGLSEVDATDPNSFSVYPNPVITGHLIRIENIKSTVTITDIAGRIIYIGCPENDILETTTLGWDAGCYVISTPGKKGEKLVIWKE